MRCNQCRHNNAENSKFCNNCGHNMMFDFDDQSNQVKAKVFDDSTLKVNNPVAAKNDRAIKIVVITISCLALLLAFCLAFLIYLDQRAKDPAAPAVRYLSSTTSSDEIDPRIYDFYYPEYMDSSDK